MPKVFEQVRRNLQGDEEGVVPPVTDSSSSEENLQDPSMEETMLEKVTIIASDEDQRIPRLMGYVKQLSDEGYSFRIVVDPEHEETMKAFHWEGEGMDKIVSIVVEEVSEADSTSTDEVLTPKSEEAK